MRSLVALYLGIGIMLLLLGWFATGACPNRNADPVNNAVFVLTWPVGFYGYAIRGGMTPQQWLHYQGCEGGIGAQHASLAR